MDHLEAKVQKHDIDLYYGNGKPGLTTRIALTEDRIDGVKEIIDKIAATQSRTMLIVLATLLTVLGDIVIRLAMK